MSITKLPAIDSGGCTQGTGNQIHQQMSAGGTSCCAIFLAAIPEDHHRCFGRLLAGKKWHPSRVIHLLVSRCCTGR